MALGLVLPIVPQSQDRHVARDLSNIGQTWANAIVSADERCERRAGAAVTGELPIVVARDADRKLLTELLADCPFEMRLDAREVVGRGIRALNVTPPAPENSSIVVGSV
jgi:hypothetical protein